MDNPHAVLRWLVLAVLLSPLAFALLVGGLGRLGAPLVRRAAAALAMLHLLMAGALALQASTQLLNRASARTGPESTSVTFQPIGVPGDPGHASADPADNGGGETHGTAWSLLTLETAPPGVAPGDVQFFVGVDGLNLWLVLLTSLMTLVAVWLSWSSIRDNVAGYYGWLFALEGAMIGAFLAFDVILFYAFFELTLIPAFFLIGFWGVGPRRRAAAGKFFLYTLLGSLFTLAGAIGVVLTNPTPVFRAPLDGGQPGRLVPVYGPVQIGNPPVTVEPEAGPISFAIPQLLRNVRIWGGSHYRKVTEAQGAAERMQAERDRLTEAARNAPADGARRQALAQAEAQLALDNAARNRAAEERAKYERIQLLCFFALMAGFAVKIPIVPFHTWQPAAYGEAPVAVMMLLSAVLAKLGTFGVLRVVLPLTPGPAFHYGLPVFGFLGAFGVVYAAFVAYGQRDIKQLLAYSSISHLGLLVLGLFALNREGLAGATLHMLNHGLATGAMIGLLAYLHDRYRTLDRRAFGGLIAAHPAYAFFFFLIALAGVGLPGLNNFVSEMLILAGLFDPGHTRSLGGGYALAVAAAFGIFLSAWYTMTLLRDLFFGPLREPELSEGTRPGLTRREALGFGVPAFLCVLLGVYPQPILDTIRYDVAVIARSADQVRVLAGYAPAPPSADR